MKNKKGELTSKQIITIVILIISFVIILAFLLMLNLKGEIDKEACRNSVALKGAFSEIPLAGGLTKNLISLKCRTQDVCLSMGAGCEEEVDETISVKKEELMKEISELFVDCWWMMGEGKINYGSKGDCAICYKVYFDAGIGTLAYEELYSYMANNKISDKSMSYLFYLYKKSNVDSVLKEEKKKELIDLNEEYVIVTKIKEKEDHVPPELIKFSSKDLEDFGCSKFVTEV